MRTRNLWDNNQPFEISEVLTIVTSGSGLDKGNGCENEGENVLGQHRIEE